MKYKAGDVVAIHYKKDKIISETNAWGISFFDYSKHSDYKKSEIILIKKHWNYFFKTMILLDDGFWYSMKDITPVVRCYAVLS